MGVTDAQPTKLMHMVKASNLMGRMLLNKFIVASP